MIVYSFMPDYVNDFSYLLYGSIRLWLLEESRPQRMNYGLESPRSGRRHKAWGASPREVVIEYESPRSGRQLKRLTAAVARFAGS